MRITRDTVEKLNAWALAATGEQIGIGFIGHLGGALTYVDRHDAGREFTGKTATREAALFFGFAAHEYVTRLGGEYPPAWVDELLWALLDSPKRVTLAGDAGLAHVDTILPRRPRLTLVAAA